MSAFWDDTWHWFKARPWAIAGAATIALGGAYLYYRSASSGSAASAATPNGTLSAGDNPELDQLAAQYSLAEQQLQAQTGVATTQAGLQQQQETDQANLYQSEIAAQLQLAAINAGVQTSANATAAQIAAAQIAGSQVVNQQNTQRDVDVANIQGQTQVSVATIQGSTAVQLGAQTQAEQEAAIAAQLAGLENTNSTQLQETQLNTNAAVTINSQNAATSLGIAQLQHESTDLQTTDALTGLEDQIAGNLAYATGQNQTAITLDQQNNAAALAYSSGLNTTQISLAQIASGTTEATTQLNDAAAVNINDSNNHAAVTLGEDTNAAALAATQSNNAVLAQYLTSSEDVANNEIAAQTHVADDTANIYEQALAGVNAGVYNKGGAGGANQVSVLGAIFGSSTAAAASSSKSIANAAETVSTNNLVASLAKTGAAAAILA
jgi:hypothetical protein